MTDYFVDRENEVKAFQKAVNDLYKDEPSPQILLFHGTTGMGKSWLVEKCVKLAQHDQRKPFIIKIDCNRTRITLENILYEIHLALEKEYKDQFKTYDEFIEKVEKIENKVDEEAKANPENAQKIAGAVSGIASKVIADTVPGANTFIGEKNIEKVTGLTANLIAEGITAVRQKFARRKLDREEYRLFQKDLQAERTSKLAELLNEIVAQKEAQRIVLFIDRFEKFVLSTNDKSDTTFYEYWHRNFLNRLDGKILVVQTGRLNFKADYDILLTKHFVYDFELQEFSPKDIQKILQEQKILHQKLTELEECVQLIFEKTAGYPVSVGALRSILWSAKGTDELLLIKNQLLNNELDILERSIAWLMDRQTDEQSRTTVYKLAICCNSNGKIVQDAIKFLLQDAELEFPRIEAEILRLAQQFSFINARDWTMHELARIFILRHLKIKAPDYIQQINHKMSEFYSQRAGLKATGGAA